LTEDIGVFFLGDGVFQLLAGNSLRPFWRVITSRRSKCCRFTISKPSMSVPTPGRARFDDNAFRAGCDVLSSAALREHLSHYDTVLTF
jgi:tRNA 2-thiouridine synthesizing protein C